MFITGLDAQTCPFHNPCNDLAHCLNPDKLLTEQVCLISPPQVNSRNKPKLRAKS